MFWWYSLLLSAPPSFPRSILCTKNWIFFLFSSFFKKRSHSGSLYYLTTLEWSHPPGATWLKETNSSTSRRYQMPITPWLVVGFCAYLPDSTLEFVWLELKVLGMLFAIFFFCNVPIVSRKHCFLEVLYHLWLLQSLCPFSHEGLWASEGRVWYMHSIYGGVLHSHLFSACDQLRVSLLIAIYLKKLLYTDLGETCGSMGIVINQ